MEAKGSVNQYMPYTARHAEKRGVMGDIGVFGPVFTIHLAAGVTPAFKQFYGVEYASQFFRLSAHPKVTHAWYRPADMEFARLAPAEQEWVLSGGLLCAELSVAAARQVEEETPITEAITPEEFGDWCLKTYGRRLARRAEIKEGGSARLSAADGPDLHE